MKIKHALVALAMSYLPLVAMAQSENFTYRFSGMFQADFYYNSRQCEESSEGFTMLFPKDRELDPDGGDINKHQASDFFNYHSWLGLDLTGPKLGVFKTSGTFVIDFRGTASGKMALLNIRIADFRLESGNHLISIGLSRHELNNTIPEVMNLNRGAPYHPLGRNPQIRYQYRTQSIMLVGSMLWQSTSRSIGPEGTSSVYMRNSGIPELVGRVEVHNRQASLGAVVSYMSITPRLSSDEGYKVSERVNGVTYQIYGRVRHGLLTVSAQSTLSQNLTHLNSLGGYGVVSKDDRTGEQKYKPLRISQNWMSVMYGSRWRGGMFAGYVKNLGATEEVTDLIGRGTNVDDMYTGLGTLTYNIKQFRIGVEYSYTHVNYGTNTAKGKVSDTHGVTNHRFVVSSNVRF